MSAVVFQFIDAPNAGAFFVASCGIKLTHRRATVFYFITQGAQKLEKHTSHSTVYVHVPFALLLSTSNEGGGITTRQQRRKNNGR